jgi:outer membrane autotransporter protein
VGALRPEVSLYAALPALAQLSGAQTLANWHTRQGNADQGRERDGVHLWARGFGARGEVDGQGLQHDGPRFDYLQSGAQVGVDGAVQTTREREDRVGTYASFARTRADVDHEGAAAGRLELSSAQLGAYWTQLRASGVYVDTVVQGGRLSGVHSHSAQGIDADTGGWTAGGSVEVGREFALSADRRWRLEPQVQLSAQRVHLDDLADSGGSVALGDSSSVIGRAGLRLVEHWGPEAAGNARAPEANSTWVRVNVQQEFAGRGEATFQTTTGPLVAASSLRGTVGEVELGTSARLPGNSALTASVAYQASLSGVQREGVSGSLIGNTGGALGAGIGLTRQVTRSTSVGARVDYGRGSEGQPDGVTAHVGLTSNW